MRRKSKVSPNKAARLEEARAAHANFLASYGITAKKRVNKKSLKGVDMPNLKIDNEKNVIQTSDVIDGSCPKKDIFTDHLWKKDGAEKASTMKAIRDKANRAVPLYNKGGYQYATDGHDPTKDGRRKT